MADATIDKSAPMASAPMRYRDDGAVDWGTMWESFCALAAEGGPPHRSDMLYAPTTPPADSAGYALACDEIVRGIRETAGLAAAPFEPGWIAVQCDSPGMARWLAEAIPQEGVQARHDDDMLLVPVGDGWSVAGEIKNVITVVAKTTHYWREHLPPDARRALVWQAQIARLASRLRKAVSR
jgi:sirohydrochlorin cobaltochelatase